jgi:hypothetical protein
MTTTYRIYCPRRADLHNKMIEVNDLDPARAPFDIAYEIEPDASGRRQFVPAFAVR